MREEFILTVEAWKTSLHREIECWQPKNKELFGLPILDYKHEIICASVSTLEVLY